MEMAIAWISGVLSVVLLTLNLSAWRSTFRIYNGIPIREFIETARVVRGSSLFVTIIAAVLALVVFAAFLPVYILFIPAPFLLFVAMVFLDSISRRIMPPVVLVLCSSTSRGVLMAREVKQRLMGEFYGGVRISLLLDARVPGTLGVDYLFSIGIDNLRQRASKEWTEAVLRLMRFVPAIVLDLRHDTDAMRVEHDLIRQYQLDQKTFVLFSPRNAMPHSPEQSRNRFTRVEDLLNPLVARLRECASDGDSNSVVDEGAPIERVNAKNVWMRCPSTGKGVKTGVNSRFFDNWNGRPPKDAGRVRCSECGEWHNFDATNTWLEDMGKVSQDDSSTS